MLQSRRSIRIVALEKELASNPQPLTVRDIQDVLSDGEALLLFATGDNAALRSILSTRDNIHVEIDGMPCRITRAERNPVLFVVRGFPALDP
jgi:hypothetical protein